MTNDDKHLANRRQEILEAAVKVFDACGYSAATMEAVAAEAGISKGSIYNYFQNKQDLFGHVFKQSLAASDLADTEPDRSLPASQRLEAMIDTWFVRLSDCRRIGGLFLEFWATAARQQREEMMASFFNDMYSRGRENIRLVVQDGIASGEFGDQISPDVASSLILAVIDGLTLQTILDVMTDVSDEHLEALKRAVLAALRPPLHAMEGQHNG
jgi:AcrR family transcriptional regulator